MARSRIIETEPTAPAPRWARLDSALLVAVVAVAAILRLVSLGRPSELVFDEIFYARDACWYVFGSEAICGISDLASRAHPPLGKWLIGSGIAAFGYEPFGWRVAAAVAGIISVALLYVLAWQLLRRWTPGTAASVGAGAASALLATDFLHLVQSRVGMLDAFITLFVIGTVLAIVLDRDRDRSPAKVPWWWRLTLGRPWRLLAGACLGAAAATKWSGAYVAPAVIGLVIAWEIVERRRADPAAGWRAWIGRAVRSEALPTIVLLGVVPVLVYVASYTGRMPGELLALPWQTGSVWRGIWDHQGAMLDFHTALGVVPVLVYVASYTGRMPGDLLALPWQIGSVWRGIWDHQGAMLDFHTALGGEHPYQSPPWSWVFVMRPVAYWFSDVGGTYREILAMGNPVAWWPGLVALAGLVVTWWRAGWGAWRPEPVILAGAASTFLPWLVLSGDRGQTFIWYLLPTIPFLCLALAFFAALAWQRMAGRVATAVYAFLLVVSFGFWVPLLVALPLDPDGWRLRIPFRDCAGQTLPDDTTSQGSPPPGWCWI